LLNKLPIPVGVPARGKSRPVEPGRVTKIVAVGHAVEVSGGPQAFGGRSGLVLGVVLRRLLVSTCVVGGAVEAKKHGMRFYQFRIDLLYFENEVFTK